MKRAAKIAGAIVGAAFAVSTISVSARADTENANVTLTPGQTLALYGNKIGCTFYDKNNSPHTIYTFDYVGVSTEYVGSGAYGQNLPILGDILGTSAYNSVYFKTILQSSPYLVYKINLDDGYFPSTYDGYHLSFNITLHPNLAGITNYVGQFMFSTSSNANPAYPRTQTTVLYNTTQGVKNIRTETGSGTSALCPTYIRDVGQYGQTADRYTLYCAFTDAIDQNAVYFNNERYNLSDIDISWYGAGGVANTGVIGYSMDIYLYIQCPTLWNYTPPPETTAQTTRRSDVSLMYGQSTAAQQTVDLSHLESGVAAIVEQGVEVNNNLDWIGNNMYIGVNNLAHICNQLDAIYAAMLRSGQIPVDSTDDILIGVQSGLTSYTTARIPDDARDGLTFWAWFMSKIMTQAWIASLAAFGGFLAVTYFILFRGRNS